MTVLSAIFMGVLLLVGAVNAIAFAAASVRVHLLKTEGRLAADTPDFLSSLWAPFGAQLIEHVYTDHHRIYGSPFVTGCVQVLRIGTPAFLASFIGVVVLGIAGA